LEGEPSPSHTTNVINQQKKQKEGGRSRKNLTASFFGNNVGEKQISAPASKKSAGVNNNVNESRTPTPNKKIGGCKEEKEQLDNWRVAGKNNKNKKIKIIMK